MSFKLIETKELNDIHSLAKLYEHEETGAQVLVLDNDDTNKAFTIAFKTPPYNDNGIAHILEHSVLNGSDKYPSKEPFVELIKGSLNTFVNAMTFSDKTIYPVASTNEQDFQNLMGVYLDAVFQPKLYSDSQILAQEGWHYHLENPEDELIYKGVVYNEMKGATASPERQLYTNLMRHLYAGTIYSHESGGLPAAIPSLTQREFIDFHQRYYHPSNSLTILYGDFDQAKAFASLAEYFDGKERQAEKVNLAISVKQPAYSSIRESYSITEGDDPTDKDFLSLAWHVTTVEDTIDDFGMNVLEDILVGHNQSPLKKALLEAEIGGDIDGDYDEVGYAGMFMIMAKYSSADRMDRFKQVVIDTLTRLVKEGISQELIQASLNKIKFDLKESAISESNPRGVIYAITALSSWLYEQSPYKMLEFSESLAQLNELAKEGYFEDLIQRKLLDNPLRIDLTLNARPGKNDQLEADTLKRLKEFKETLNAEQIDRIVEETKSLIQRQETPDNAADLARIPRLTKDDLSTEVDINPLTLSSLAENTTFYHADEFTSGIDYVNLYFDISDLPMASYSTLSLLSRFLGKLPTKHYSVADLQTQIDFHTGGISSSISMFEEQQTGRLKPYFVLRGKVLEDSFQQLIELMKEIMVHTEWTDYAEMLNITQSLISGFDQQINHSAHALAANRAMSQIKPAAKLSELIGGIDQYEFLKTTRDHLKATPDASLSDELSGLLTLLLNQQRLNVLYTGSADRVETIKQTITQAFAELNSIPLGEATVFTAGKKQNEAFVTAQDVNYIAQASDATAVIPFNGITSVLGTILRYDYLWNHIRVKGGAYGALYRHQRNGNLMLSSYRDPNIDKTLNTYASIPDFIEQLDVDDAELLKYMIGTMSDLEQPLSAYDKGLKSFVMLQSNISKADLVQLKEEILNVSQADIQQLHGAYKTVLEQGTVTIIGNKAQIEAEKDLFDVVLELY